MGGCVGRYLDGWDDAPSRGSSRNGRGGKSGGYNRSMCKQMDNRLYAINLGLINVGLCVNCERADLQ
ncbi:unnamed protein product [Knipowitschia caucasica]